MNRRRGMREAGDPVGLRADDEVKPKRRLWVFLAVAGGLTAFWVIMSLPRVVDPQGEQLPYVTKRAGWPDEFARWSISNDTGETIAPTFSQIALLGDLVTLAAPIIVAWVIIRKVGRAPGQAAAQPRAARGPAPGPGDSPSHRPPGRAQASGGWG